MKAIVYTKYGLPDVLQLRDLEKPIPRDNELLIHVHAATVNRTDCANLTAKPFIMRFSLGLFKPVKQILGTEFSGIVEAVGKDEREFKAGDRVFGFDDGILGSYAEYLTISEDKGIVTMPDNLSFEQAAASLEGAHYAYNFINKVDLQAGNKVLVNGASGAIGSAMVQLLRYYGADVVATCNTKNMELIQSLGARKVIDYTKSDFTQDNEHYDYVFDSVGKSTFGKCKRLLKPSGVYISSELGPQIQNVFFSLITFVLGRMPFQHGKGVKFPYPPDIKRSAVLIQKLISEGRFSTVIDRVYHMEQIADAYRYVLKGEKTGNVVVSINQRAQP